MSEKLASARLKIERAKKHINDLNTIIVDFFAATPYKILAKRDPQTRRMIYYLGEVAAVPDDVPVIAGEAIQCLRSGLDQLAYQLWLAGSRAGNERRVYFPIFPSQKQKSEFPPEIKGMGQAVVDALESIEAYKGGKGNHLWILGELNNTDKHRLIITAAGDYTSIDACSAALPSLAKVFPSDVIDIFASMSLSIRPDGALCPLYAGGELFMDVPDAEFNENLKFTFEITLHEPGIIEREPIIPFLYQLTQFVENTLSIFERLL